MYALVLVKVGLPVMIGVILTGRSKSALTGRLVLADNNWYFSICSLVPECGGAYYSKTFTYYAQAFLRTDVSNSAKQSFQNEHPENSKTGFVGVLGFDFFDLSWKPSGLPCAIFSTAGMLWAPYGEIRFTVGLSI
jgi:hypothetical protein